MSETCFLSRFSDWFWTETFWLPENVTWKDVEKTNNFRPITDFFYCLPIVFSYLLIQRMLQRFLFEPLARWNGIRINENKPPDNPVLEKVFSMKKKSPTKYEEIKKLAAELNWAERQVERWFRDRERLHKGGIYKKFKESGWRLVFYSFTTAYGIFILRNKPWAWNLNYCFTDFYTFKMTDDIWWYYMLELSFYVSLMFTQFADVKRKDFREMLYHHIFTISLIVLSFLSNIVRFGSLILLCHDIADVPLEFGKLMKYLKQPILCNIAFVVFLISWFPSRLVYLPFVLIPTYIKDCHLIGGFVCHCGAFFLFSLVILHVIWTYMIFQVMNGVLFKGKLDDVRSSDESD